MQMSKTLLVVCAAATLVSPFSLFAADSDAQEKARQALEQKLNELQTQPTPAKSVPAAATPAAAPETKAAPTAPAAPAVQPNPPPAAVAPTITTTAPPPAKKSKQPKASKHHPVIEAPPPVDPEVIAKAREAMRQKMGEVQSQENAQTMMAPAQPQPAAAMSAPATATSSTEAEAHPVAPPAKMSKAEQKRQAEEQARLQKEQAKQAKMAGHQMATQEPTRIQMQAPPAPVSASKEQQLQELLLKYRADEISADQYQAERAKILGAP